MVFKADKPVKPVCGLKRKLCAQLCSLKTKEKYAIFFAILNDLFKSTEILKTNNKCNASRRHNKTCKDRTLYIEYTKLFNASLTV